MGRKHSHPVRAATVTGADDFTLIRGIGPKIATRLHKTGILTFAQLAELSAEEIAAKHSGLSAKRITKETWTSQARNLVPKRPPAPEPTSATAGEIQQQHYATFIVELLLDADNSVRRTRVTQVQTETEEAWPVWEDTRLTNFFVRRAGLSFPQPAPAPLLEPISHPAKPTVRPPNQKIETGLSGVLRLCDLAILPLGSDVPQNSVRAGETFNVRVVLDLTEVKRSAEVPFTYTATIWAKKLGVKSRQLVGEGRGTFMPADTASCSAKVEITSPGIYHLEALVALTEQGRESLPQHRLMAVQAMGPLQVL
jgi:hypothetical protein